MVDRLFKPITIGNAKLKHRVVMAPLTRLRATKNHVPGVYVKEYYEQRASVPGTLIITEATLVSPRAGGYKNVPGLWNDDQVKAWKEVTDAVHAKGSTIFAQLWALGRVAMPAVLEAEGGYHVASSSAVPVDADAHKPAAMTEEEINICTEDFANAARNAMKAGFDGVEIHGANGYLIDQFWQDVVNQRTDSYGGSIENRARFGLDIAKAVIATTGDSTKVAMRLSPWSTFQGMKMVDPLPQFSYITSELKKLDLAYLHLVESRISGSSADGVYHDVTKENDPLIELWGKESPLLLAGGFTPEKATRVLSAVYPEYNVAIAFGRSFISNPDLPFRIQKSIELNPYDRSTFYAAENPKGYIDYPFSQSWQGLEARS